MSPGRTVVGRRAGLVWFLAGYAGLAGFLAEEATTRAPGVATLEASDKDAGSTRGLIAAFSAAAVLAPLLRRLPLRGLPRICGPLGVALQAGGLALRVWSMRTLSSSYTRTLRVSNEQEVVDRGPYRRVRHPGYLGSLLVWVGFGLASCSLPVIASVTALVLPAYARRIDVEEQLLRSELRGYDGYQGRTKKLVPWVW